MADPERENAVERAACQCPGRGVPWSSPVFDHTEVVRAATTTPFAAIPEGWFLMGSDEGPADERPAHRVWVDAFELAVSPVTCAE